MRTQIEDTTLVITGVVYRKYQTQLRRVEAGETIVVLSVEDTKTGETGLLSRYQSYDKRDVDDEEIRTSNAKLFADNHPEAMLFDEYAGIWEDGDIGDTEPVCDVKLSYQNGPHDDGTDGDWGLYVK